jgi:hypothetical protein
MSQIIGAMDASQPKEFAEAKKWMQRRAGSDGVEFTWPAA